MGLYQKLWQNLGGLHQFAFCCPMPSSSHGLSLSVETRKTVLTVLLPRSGGVVYTVYTTSESEITFS